MASLMKGRRPRTHKRTHTGFHCASDMSSKAQGTLECRVTCVSASAHTDTVNTIFYKQDFGFKEKKLCNIQGIKRSVDKIGKTYV